MDKLQIYKCEKEGTVVEVVVPGACGDLACCGDIMQPLPEQWKDASTEKHVPLIEKKDNGYLVKVGSTKHPMVDAHYIMFIELQAGDMIMRKFLKPGDEPEAFFETSAQNVTAREYCNMHGLWKG